MKYTLTAILVAITTFSVSGQLHSLHADVGYAPGASLTYNYRFAKHWSYGIGMQAYEFYPGYGNPYKFVPALYGDIRLYSRPRKNNQFFTFADFGIDFYKQGKRYYRDSITVYNIPHNNGFYSGLGFGYFRRVSKNGAGAYVSFKIIANWYNAATYSFLSDDKNTVYSYATGTMALSVGYRLGSKARAKWEEYDYAAAKRRKTPVKKKEDE